MDLAFLVLAAQVLIGQAIGVIFTSFLAERKHNDREELLLPQHANLQDPIKQRMRNSEVRLTRCTQICLSCDAVVRMPLFTGPKVPAPLTAALASAGVPLPRPPVFPPRVAPPLPLTAVPRPLVLAVAAFAPCRTSGPKPAASRSLSCFRFSASFASFQLSHFD